MLPQWQKGICKQIKQISFNTKHFWIELPNTIDFNFKPGQFITIDLPIAEQRNKRWRSYSISNAPAGSNIIELLLVLMSNGIGSAYMFNQVKVGDELMLRGPQGVFILPPVLDKDLFMICTGTGIAPYRSMLNYIMMNKVPHKAIKLIFGTRTHSDILLEDEMKEWATKIPGFTYHITLSREERVGYYHGYVHAIYESMIANTESAHFMLCGWRPMIDEAKKRLLSLGFDKKCITEELYG
jgi:ferredoxin-NADP reductase